MGQPPVTPTDDNLRLVLSVILGEMTIGQAARHGKVSEQSVSRWKQQFLAGGKDGRTASRRKFIVLADVWPEWGHRRLVDLARLDGIDVSDSTALRALKRTGRVLAPELHA